jgi:FkbM family methyltransferase
MAGATGNIYCGLHEFEDMGFVLHLLGDGDLFVDVGANIGSYTILASVVCGANVVAVEPVACTFERLRDNVRLNRVEERVELRNVGVGSAPGELLFTTAEFDSTNHVVEDASSGPVERVQAVTLDGLMHERSPVLLKIDVEGHEDAVIEGAVHTLSAPSLLGLIMEVNLENPLERSASQALLAAGFAPFSYDPLTRTLTPMTPHSGNTLYLRNREAVEQRLQDAPRRVVLGVEF